MSENNLPIFISLGMLIIDDNYYPPSWNKKPDYDILGGGGSYAIVGSRIIAGRKFSTKISGIIDKGSDFPKSIEDELKSWDAGIIFRYDENRLTTRGINIYDENDIRHFKYQTAKKRIEVDDILNNASLKASKCFHLICSIERCETIIDQILKNVNERPRFIYEPLPDDCKSENFDKLTKLLPKIDIFTPNLNEASDLANLSRLPENEQELIELSSKFEPYLTLHNSGLVLRCGAKGCFIKSSDTEILLPAYHTNQSKVIDVTGGGNSFCGGFMTGFYLSSGNWLIGGICGNLASGCIIEKLGMPVRVDSNYGERWNGSSLMDRLHLYVNNNIELLKEFDFSKLNWF